MSTQTIREQFNAKAAKAKPKDFLGTATEQVRFNDEKNRFEQCYTNGIIVSKSPSPQNKDDLIVLFGPLFNAAWSQGGAWLGDPLEDVYEACNYDGKEVLVQRFKIGAFVEEIRSAFKAYVRNYIETNLADVAGRLLNSESLWDGVVNMIPRFQPELERLIRTEGVPLILAKLDIQGRIHSAVDKMDVAEFHGMINEVAAQHLGAIQVLGYLLGAVAGALTLLA